MTDDAADSCSTESRDTPPIFPVTRPRPPEDPERAEDAFDISLGAIVHAAEDGREWIFAGWFRNTAGRFPSFVMGLRDDFPREGLPREYHASIAATVERRFPDVARYRRNAASDHDGAEAPASPVPAWKRLDAAISAIALATPATLSTAFRELEAARSAYAPRGMPAALAEAVSGAVDGAEMKRIRTSVGMTQAELADALGMTATYVGLMERDQKPIERRTSMAMRHIEQTGGTA